MPNACTVNQSACCRDEPYTTLFVLRHSFPSELQQLDLR
jgi:hypothetical protein